MKRLSVSSGLAALVLLAAATIAHAAEPSKAHILSRAELDALLAKPEQVVIVDVRRPDELTSVGGFPVYLSIQSGELEQRLAYIPRDRTVVTVSNNAGRAGRAADLLAAKGFKVAGAIGAKKYEEEGGKLAKVAPPAGNATAASAQPKAH
jgi:rhodanese-related sulfurtransferase